MATIQELKDAFIRADDAGDKEVAASFLKDIEAAMAQTPVPTEAEVGRGQAPEGTAWRGPAQPGDERPQPAFQPVPRKGFKENLLESGQTAVGLGENALTAITGVTSGPAAAIGNTLSAGLSGLAGNPDLDEQGMPKDFNTLMNEGYEAGVYSPRTEEGQRIAGDVGNVMNKAQLPPFIPEAPVLSNASRTAPGARGLQKGADAMADAELASRTRGQLVSMDPKLPSDPALAARQAPFYGGFKREQFNRDVEAARREREAAKARADVEIDDFVNEVGGKGTVAEAGEAIIDQGFKAYNSIIETFDDFYKRAGAPRRGVARVRTTDLPGTLDSEFSQHTNPLVRRLAEEANKPGQILNSQGQPTKLTYTPAEVKGALRIVRGQVRKLMAAEKGGTGVDPRRLAMQKLQTSLENDLKTWSRTSPAARKQYKLMEWVDDKFANSVGKIRENFDIRGSGRYRNQWPDVPTLLGEARSPKSGGTLAARTKELLPGAVPDMQKLITAMARQDRKFLTSDFARTVFDPKIMDEVEAMLKRSEQ